MGIHILNSINLLHSGIERLLQLSRTVDLCQNVFSSLPEKQQEQFKPQLAEVLNHVETEAVCVREEVTEGLTTRGSGS